MLTNIFGDNLSYNSEYFNLFNVLYIDVEYFLAFLTAYSSKAFFLKLRKFENNSLKAMFKVGVSLHCDNLVSLINKSDINIQCVS